MDVVVLVFSSASSAARVVAGLPAAARALREVALAGARRCAIAVPGGWAPDRRTRIELDRLAQGTPYTVIDIAALTGCAEPALLVQGERLVTARRLEAVLAGGGVTGALMIVAPAGEWTRLPPLSESEAAPALDRAARAIVAATLKPGDGIVSQLINRPISQAVSRQLLRFVGMNPFVATAGAAALAVAMLVVLTAGGAPGLLGGAVLYQLASLVDGIDGEIARATFRTSRSGALVDSLVDAVTNIGFIGGVAINLWIRGHAPAALAGSFGLVILALGLFLIGRGVRGSADAFSFDGVKERVRRRPSWVMQMLIRLTMRDFFAVAWLVVIGVGAAAGGLIVFSAITAGWLVVVLFTLRQRPG